MKPITLSEIKEKGVDPFLVKTIESSNDHNYYLDELMDGQFLISYGEFPKAIYSTLSEAKKAYELFIPKS